MHSILAKLGEIKRGSGMQAIGRFDFHLELKFQVLPDDYRRPVPLFRKIRRVFDRARGKLLVALSYFDLHQVQFLVATANIELYAKNRRWLRQKVCYRVLGFVVHRAPRIFRDLDVGSLDRHGRCERSQPELRQSVSVLGKEVFPRTVGSTAG